MLTGDMVENLTDKHFTIASAISVDKPDYNNPKLTRKKIIATIILKDGTQIEMYVNKTSQMRVASLRGTKLKDWVGYEGELKVLAQMVGDKEKKVIYIK